jgi:DNA-binding MarR family transcriptional regulator
MTRHSGPRDAPATVHRLRALTLLLDDAAAAFAARHGLSATEVRALICLLDQERAGAAASPTWLATKLKMTTASGTALLDRLERAGHVRRVPRTDDRRRVDIVVTPSAKNLGWTFFGPLIDATAGVLQARTTEQRVVIDAFLEDVLDVLGRAGLPGDADRSHRAPRLGTGNERACSSRSTARPSTRPRSAGEEES